MKEKKEIIDQFYNERFNGTSLPNTKAEWNVFKLYTKKRKQRKYLRNTSITVVSVLSVLSFLFVFKYYFTNKEIESDNEKTKQKIETADSIIPTLTNHSTKTIPQAEPVKSITLPIVKNDSVISSKRTIFNKEKLIDSEESNVVTSDSTIIDIVHKHIDTIHKPEANKRDTNTLVINKKEVHVNKKTIIRRKLSNTDSLEKR
jgi:hypothetical protein